MVRPPSRQHSLAVQAYAIRQGIPTANCRIYRGQLTATFTLQPHQLSQIFRIYLRYRLTDWPRVTVVEPALTLAPGAARLPHVYPGNELCLFMPGEWQAGMLLTMTVIPWAAEWLYFYELWVLTGEWLGGGHQIPQTG